MTTWNIPPLERLQLHDWLKRYNGHAIVRVEALSQLAHFGISYDPQRHRLIYERVSAPLHVHKKSYFEEEAKRVGAYRAAFIAGDWRGVWAIDIAESLLLLAGYEMASALSVGGRDTRFDLLCSLLKPEGTLIDGDDVAGEIRT